MTNPLDPFGYYAALGLDPNVDEDDIKAAYKRRVKKYHPDINKENKSDEILKFINQSYENLSNANKRLHYDRLAKKINNVDDVLADKKRHMIKNIVSYTYNIVVYFLNVYISVVYTITGTILLIGLTFFVLSEIWKKVAGY